MKIRIEPHTILRANERGATEEEIVDTIKTGVDIHGKSGRFGKFKIFSYSNFRNGKFYEEKRVEVFYIFENDTFVTVTVYVFYGKF